MAKPDFFLFVDNDKYDWTKSTITGAELRLLAAVPQSATIYLKVPGKTDQPIEESTTIDLEAHHGPARFSTQASGSQAG